MERACHIANLSANLFRLQQEQRLCDVQLQCCDGIVNAHSVVLSSCSNILCNMITDTNMKLPLNAYPTRTVQLLVDYLYTGDVDVKNVGDPVSLYKLMRSFGITANLDSLQRILLNSVDGKNLIEEENRNVSSLTPSSAVTLSEELLKNLVEYACAPTEVKQENDTMSEDDEEHTNHQLVDEPTEIPPLKVKLPKTRNSFEMIKNQKSKRQVKGKKPTRRKLRRLRSLKKADVEDTNDGESESDTETVKNKRAKWRDVYYKKKALGTLKYQKFLSPKLPAERKCSQCGVILRTYRSLVQHKNTVHGIPFSEGDIEKLQMRCTHPGCDFITVRPVKMQYHRDTHESDNLGEVPAEYSCSFCDKKYKSKKELRNHSKCHTAVIRNCEICDKPLKGYYYSVHMNTVHNKDHVWQCHLCDYRVRGRELWFKYHLITKHNDTSRGTVEIFRCKYCDYTAPKKQNVARHTRVRHEIALGLRPKEAICDICGKEFGEKGLMVAHRARHTDPERFKCSFCKYKSPDYRSFETHVRTQHTQKDVRPWKCDLCSHAAKEKGNLKKHFRSKHKMSEEDATARMKTIKPVTTEPIYVPLSEYKDPEDNTSLPPPPRHRILPTSESGESGEILREESLENKGGDFDEQNLVFPKATNAGVAPAGYSETLTRNGRNVNVQDLGEPSAQVISSTVAAVLQAAEQSQEPSLHTLAAAAMMPQSMHPAMSIFAGVPQVDANGLPSQVTNGNALPTASCFFGSQPTLPQQTAQVDEHIRNESRQQQLHLQQQQQQHGFDMAVKYEGAPSSQPYLEKYNTNHSQHNFSQV